MMNDIKTNSSGSSRMFRSKGISTRIMPRIRFDYSIRHRRVTERPLRNLYNRSCLGSGTISFLTPAILTLTGPDISRLDHLLKVSYKFQCKHEDKKLMVGISFNKIQLDRNRSFLLDVDELS